MDRCCRTQRHSVTILEQVHCNTNIHSANLCVLPLDVLVVPNGHRSGLQQPVHEPAGPTRTPWRNEPGRHGFRHEQPQYERPSNGHQPGPDPGHGPFRGSRPKNASAGVSWGPSARRPGAGGEEAVSGRGERRHLLARAG